jgi:hypothetical protein
MVSKGAFLAARISTGAIAVYKYWNFGGFTRIVLGDRFDFASAYRGKILDLWWFANACTGRRAVRYYVLLPQKIFSIE